MSGTIEHAAHEGKVVAALAIPLIGVMAALQGSDPNIAATALIEASRSLGMTGDTQALAASVSTLALSATVISTGLLADRVGRRRVLVVALLTAAVGDLIVVIAPTSGVYILGRAVAGIGLGAVYGASFAYIRAVVPPQRIPGAMGTFAAVVGLASLIFTFVGGNLSGTGWRLAFLVIPVMAVLCVPAAFAVLPVQEAQKGSSSDLLGQLLLAAGLIVFLYGVSTAAKSLTSAQTWGPALVGLLLLAAFFWWEARNEKRFFPVSLFREPVFLAAVFVGVVFNFSNAVGFLQVTNLWRYITGLDSQEISFWQLPMLLSGIVFAFVFGRLMLRGMTNRTAVLIGSFAATAGFVYLAFFPSAKTVWGFAAGLILIGSGMVIVSLPYGNLIISQAPPRYFGPVTSSRTTIGQFFYSLGLAVGIVIVDRMTDGGTVDRLVAAGVPPTQTGLALDAVTAYAQDNAEPSTTLGREALADAVTSYSQGFTVTMLVAAAASLLFGLLAAWLLTRGRDEHGKLRGDDPSGGSAATAPVPEGAGAGAGPSAARTGRASAGG